MQKSIAGAWIPLVNGGDVVYNAAPGGSKILALRFIVDTSALIAESAVYQSTVQVEDSNGVVLTDLGWISTVGHQQTNVDLRPGIPMAPGTSLVFQSGSAGDGVVDVFVLAEEYR